jgi:hypothetical protein
MPKPVLHLTTCQLICCQSIERREQWERAQRREVGGRAQKLPGTTLNWSIVQLVSYLQPLNPLPPLPPLI